MNITTTARHFDLSPRERELAEEKVQRLSRYFDQAFNTHIIVTKEKDRFATEITMRVAGGHDLASHNETDEVMTSVAGAVEKLESQVKKHKSRLVDRREKADATKTVMAQKEAEAETES